MVLMDQTSGYGFTGVKLEKVKSTDLCEAETSAETLAHSRTFVVMTTLFGEQFRQPIFFLCGTRADHGPIVVLRSRCHLRHGRSWCSCIYNVRFGSLPYAWGKGKSRESSVCEKSRDRSHSCICKGLFRLAIDPCNFDTLVPPGNPEEC